MLVALVGDNGHNGSYQSCHRGQLAAAMADDAKLHRGQELLAHSEGLGLVGVAAQGRRFFPESVHGECPPTICGRARGAEEERGRAGERGRESQRF